ncbi:MAG: hypothetical protein NUV34_06185 [Sulfuricaulis sp.]|nr:hypothetical protein [Sulfuricaulis sp.]
MAYGGGVEWLNSWDRKRIAAGKITDSDFYKKAGFLAYAITGVAAVLNSLFTPNVGRRYVGITDALSNGFFYAAPGVGYNLMQSLKHAGSAAAGASNAAIAEAQRIIADSGRVAANARGIAAGGRGTGAATPVEITRRGA